MGRRANPFHPNQPLRNKLAADGGLSVLGAACRAAGLEHLFKAALKTGAWGISSYSNQRALPCDTARP